MCLRPPPRFNAVPTGRVPRIVPHDQFSLDHPFPFGSTFASLPVTLTSFTLSFLPTSIGFVSSHSTFETGSFETTFTLSLDCIHFISITFLVLLVVVRVTLLFLCFRFRDVQAHLWYIHWDWSCGLCGSWSLRVCARTWRDCHRFLCWMAHISHVDISSLSRLLQHVVSNL